MFFYYITILLIPFGNHPLLSHNVAGITPIKLFGGLALCAAIIELSGEGKGQGQFKTPVSKYFLALMGVFAASLLSNFQSYNPDALLRFVSIVIFFATTVVLVNSRERFVRSMYLLLACMDVAAMYMFREYSLYGAMYNNFRPSGILGDPNYTALNLLTVIPVALLLARETKDQRLKVFLYGSLCLYLGALGLSQSRGGYIAFCVEVLMLLLILKFRVKTIVVFTLLVAVILSFLPVNVFSRFSSEDNGVKKSTDSRFELVRTGLNMFSDNFILGVGPGNFKDNSDKYNDMVSKKQIAHNSYIELAAELGVFGVVLYILIAYRTFRDLKRLAQKREEDAVIACSASGIMIGFVGYLVAATFLSAEYEKIYWFLVFTAIAAARVSSFSEAKPTVALSDGVRTLSQDSK